MRKPIFVAILLLGVFFVMTRMAEVEVYSTHLSQRRSGEGDIKTHFSSFVRAILITS